MKLSIVIPAHNEAEHIRATVEGILAAVKTECEVWVTADHCSDSTEEIVRDIGVRHPNVHVTRNDDRKGSFSNSIIASMKRAQGDYIVVTMADHCDDPTTIDRMVEVADRGADVVCGSRYMTGGSKNGGPKLQGILSRLTALLLHLLWSIPTLDAPNAFKLYRRSLLEKAGYDIPDGGTEYSMALLRRLQRAGAKIVEVPTTWTWQEAPLPWKDEWKIFKRAGAYWRALRGQ